MNKATFNFRLDTLIEEIKMHDHYDELLDLMQAQLNDDMYEVHEGV